MNSSKVTGLVLVALFAGSSVPRASAQDAAAASAPAAAQSAFSADQLDQMVGPIALYPDSLVSQILMASTYPLEIVEASRWLAKNKGLSSTALEEALKTRDWDISVKSLCALPDVVQRMNDNLDWTRDLGDACLGQKSEVLDAVQRMRAKAHEAGNLKTTEQQTVTVQEDKIIVIQSASPEVVYVPIYYPSVVYGYAYPAPYYPVYYAPPPPSYRPGLTFAAGVAVGAALYGDCHWGWGHSDVTVNVNHYNTYNQKTTNNWNQTNIKNTSGNTATQWNHDAAHRGGVNYRNADVAKQYAGGSASARAPQQQARGYASQQPAAGARPSAGAQPAPATKPSAGARPSTTTGPSSAASRGDGSNALSRDGSAGFERSASTRGAQSRGGGGGSRAGGRR